ncbi:N-6 DNA methylase [Vibrio rhizosphaerae]|uniref:N-6 DNA methylase n=1 Tax=Vibrio rhizosphaerae TaxID=398736 RepID=UPI00056F5E2B|nr:N-6 DNA methylase [Vibrio rhizosphaerae]
MNPHSLPKKKELGAYYTPPELSQVLADWAIQHADKDILEPSFGGCGFFDSSIARLCELGCPTPEEQLYGVDIDNHAFKILTQKFSTNVNISKRFILKDFIQVKPTEFSVSEFDVVLGNPPYVSMHNMTEEQRKSCDRVLRNSPFSTKTMGRNASLWAFFLLHSLEFLKNGGRVAWVLPSSLLNADYADKLIGIHQKHFKRIKVLKLAERFFKEEGAQETSIILLAEGFHKEAMPQSDLSVSVVENVTELKQAINRVSDSTFLNVKDYKLDIISSAAKFSYQTVLQQDTTKELGYYADIKIGMVTGANNYFIINRSTAEQYQLPENVLKPVVGRFSYLQGIIHDKNRHKKSVRTDKRVYLVCPTEEQMADRSSRVAHYLSRISDEDREKNRTFSKRPYWFSPGWGVDGIKADCFLSYMIHRGPRMVVNTGKQFNCTNSIHKVIFRENVSAQYKRAMAITMLSTFTQFSAELEGRAYSSGVLKIEPSAGRRIKVLFSEQCIDDLDSLKPKVEKALLQEDFYIAAQLVDEVLIKHELITREQCQYLVRAVYDLRCERYKGARNYTD